jgi:acyl carrier protein
MEFEKISEVISEQMGISKDKITMETSFTKDLGADSLDVFQIISDLEDIFDLEFSNDDAQKIVTVGDAVEFLKSIR